MSSRLQPRSTFWNVITAQTVLCAAVSFSAAQPAAAPAMQDAAKAPTALDYELFKSRVEPIFLKKRSPQHARCYGCHKNTNHFYGLSLQPLSPGNNFWTEEQSRLNFQMISRLVVPGNPDASMFPMHPLSPNAGGDMKRTHDGGRQFESLDDPDFQTIVQWIRGQKSQSNSTP